MTSSTQGSIEPFERAPRPLDPGVRIGHVHLRTADIDRVRDFYVGVLGFDVVFEARDVPGWGTTGDILFLAAGGYHHHLGFNVWRGRGVGPAPEHTVGMEHWTVELERPEEVAEVRARAEAAGVGVEPDERGFVLRDPWANALRVEVAS